MQKLAAKACRIDVKVGLDVLAFLRFEVVDETLVIEPDFRNRRLLVLDATLRRPFLQELAEQARIEVVAVVHLEREIRRRHGRQPLLREFPGYEELVRMTVEIDTLASQETVVKKRRYRKLVGLAHEGMEVLLEPRLGRPVAECNADLVGSVTALHPVRLLNPDRLEEVLERRGGSLADADDANIGRLDQGDIHTLVFPIGCDEVGCDPPGGPAAENHNTFFVAEHDRPL